MNLDAFSETNTRRLGKKPKHPKSNNGLSISSVASVSSHKQKTGTLPKERISMRRHTKTFNPYYSALSARLQSGHGVELTDDIVVLGSDGKRIPRTITLISRD